jgi:hypothetical protein
MAKKRKINYFVPIAVVAGIGIAVYTSSKPFKVYQQEKAKAEGMRADLDGLQRNNAKLREKDQLLNPVQKEEEARRMGYVRPEEKSLPSKATEPSEAAKEETKPAQKKPEPAKPSIDLRDSDNNEEVPVELR